MEDAGDRRGEETIPWVAQVEVTAQEQQLGERAAVEGGSDLPRERPEPALRSFGKCTRPGGGNGHPVVRFKGPIDPKAREPGLRLRAARRVDLGRREQGRQRVGVAPGADSALGAGLQGHGAAACEGVEDDIAGARVPRDQRMGDGRRERAEVRAHGVEAVAPESGL